MLKIGKAEILLAALMALPCATFAQVKISELPAATNVTGSDFMAIVQSNTTKRATAALIRSIQSTNVTDFSNAVVAVGSAQGWSTGGGGSTNASLLTTGTLPDARLTTNVALLPSLGSWAKTTNPATARAALEVSDWTTNPTAPATTNASALTTGTLADARLTTNVLVRSYGTATAERFLATESMGSYSSVNYGMGGSSVTGFGSANGSNIIGKVYDQQVFVAYTTSFDLSVPLSVGTNATTRAITRTNLDLVGSWLTNSNSPATTNAALLTSGTLPDARLSTNVVVRSTNGTASSSAWKLTAAPTNSIATIATNEVGVGWDELARFTVQTPVGALQMYETGSPITTPVIYWPGTIVAQRFDAVQVNGRVYASQIEGGSLGGTIANSVMQSSMPWPMMQWQSGGAENAGWPHVFTNAADWPTNGSYIPMGVVTNFATDQISGEYWSLAKLASNLPAPVSGGAASNSILTADGAGGSAFVASRVQVARLANDSYRTNTSDLNLTNNNETQLTVTLDANSVYYLLVDLLVTSPSAGGWAGYLMSSLTSTNPGQMPAGTMGRAYRPNFGTYEFYVNSFGGVQFGGQFQTQSSAFTNGRFSGTGTIRTGSSNQSLYLRWFQGTTNTNPTTLLSNSLIMVEKIWP